MLSRSGKPTGLLFSDALALARAGAELAPATRTEAIRRACGIALSKGVTALHALQRADPHDVETIELLSRGDWPVRIVVYPTTLDASWAQQQDFPRVGGCVLLDGALEAHTAALFTPYTDEPENIGQLYLSDQALQSFVLNAHERGLRANKEQQNRRQEQGARPTKARPFGATPARSSPSNAAHIAFHEPEAGELASGRLADIVVLGEDPLAVAPERLKDIRVIMTLIGGQVRYEDRP